MELLEDSPGNIVFSTALTTIEKRLPLFPVILIIGPSHSGKSRLMLQLARQLGARVHSIRRHLAPSRFAETLGLKAPQGGTPEDILASCVAEVCQFVEDSAEPLLVDDLDQLPFGRRLLETLASTLANGKAVLALPRLPSIDPMVADRIFVYRHSGLSKSEVKRWIPFAEMQGAEFPEEEEVYEKSMGNPLRLKMATSQLLLKEGSIDWSQTETDYRQLVWQKLSEPDQATIRMVSRIVYSPKTSADLMMELSSSGRQSLQDAGIYDPFTLLIEEEFLRHIRAQEPLDDIQTDRLRKLLDVADIEPRLDLLHFELEMGNQAADLFREILPGLFDSGRYRELIDLSHSFVEVLSDNDVAQVLEAKFFVEPSAELTQQAARILEDRKSPSPDLGLILARIFRRGGKPKLCGELIQRAVDVPPRTLLQMRREFGYALAGHDPKKSKELLLDVKKDNQFDDPTIAGEIEFALGIAHYELGEQENAMTSFRLAKTHYQQTNRLYDQLITERNIAAMTFNLGDVSLSREQYKNVRKKAERFGVERVIRFCVRHEAIQATYAGQFEKALKTLSQLVGSNMERRLSDLDIPAIDFSILAHLFARSYDGADTRIGTLARNPTIRENRGQQIYYESLKNLIQSFRRAGALGKLELKNDRYQLNFRSVRLELNIHTFFQVSGGDLELDWSPSDNSLKRDARFSVIYRSQIAWHLVRQGKLPRATALLESTLALAQTFQYPFWEIRSLLALALMDLHRQDPQQATEKLAACARLAPTIDPLEEHQFIPFLQAIVKNEKPKIPEASIFRAGWNRIFPDRALIYSGTPLTQAQDRFFNWLAAFTHTSKSSHVVTAQGKKRTLDTGVQRKGLTLDVARALLSHGKKTHSLSDKPMLLSLMAHLMKTAGQVHNKEELTTQVWRERYNPEAHDPRVYTSIRRLREITATLQKKDPIVTRDGRYGFDSEQEFTLILPDAPSELSERQQKILQILAGGKADRPAIEKHLGVGATIAKRELKELLDRDLIRKTGKGKQTRYEKK